MTEPVLQGYASRTETTFVILPPTERTPIVTINGTEPSPSYVPVQEDSEDEDLEIHEDFLSNTLFSRPIDAVLHAVSNGSADSLSSHAPGNEFAAEQLSNIIDPTSDDCTVYIRTADLSKVGILDGDWAIASSASSSFSRLVRVRADDKLVMKHGHIVCSPILLRNVFSDISPSSPRIHLQATPGGRLQPLIPVAKSITIARIASRVSISRVYQQQVLHALKRYFDGTKRLVKRGDLLALQSRPTPTNSSHQAVFFVVTNIDHDTLADNGNDLPGSNIHKGSVVGELGCWVDPLVTRMIQSGVEHLRVPNAFHQMLALASVAFTSQASTYDLPISILLKGARGIGKFTTSSWVAQSLGMHLFEVNCYEIFGESDTKTEGILRARFEQAISCSPCVLVIRHMDAFVQSTQPIEPGKEPGVVSALKELINDLYGAWRLSGYPVIVFGTTSESTRVPASVLSCFKHEVTFEVPGEMERFDLLQSLLSSSHLAPDVSIPSLARQTAALVAADLQDLLIRARTAAFARAQISTRADIHSEIDLFCAGISLAAADFDVALGEARSSHSQNIGAPTIPNVSWDDVGGLAQVKSEILDTIQLPLEHPELFGQDLKKRSGILLYGPPGTGKTLLAKAVATSCSLNFFSVKGPELLNMYIGESEANVRRVFQRARNARPCVIFFDELDSVAPKRGNHGDSGGVMDRIVSQLLAELDGVAAGEGGDVFVIGATNRPDLLDPALLRPGRFDRMLYLGISDTNEAQLKIIQALTRKFRLDPELDLRAIVEKCPFNFTGADFYALCSDALLKAMSRKAEGIDRILVDLNAVHTRRFPITPQYYLAEMASPADIEVTVSQEDFDAALRELTPSVSQSEMDHYATIQQRFSQPDSDVNVLDAKDIDQEITLSA
ncbi:AAA ATPase [Heterobasidion irregulare TC 32-1]|uniref:Peroxisomal ATPase PEX6 n=1 Tax=Heterobasidion irregulare (strain TC 32-1) TaxID=747525 RepID=W4KI79_HETIT|nr:AAA ATPase [Heterobasidion irregulare TC 32-1]ETW85568.1 AAA ATPase [Heterobasidion irregulare TC 32-1]